jgi:hypothetical protein
LAPLVLLGLTAAGAPRRSSRRLVSPRFALEAMSPRLAPDCASQVQVGGLSIAPSLSAAIADEPYTGRCCSGALLFWGVAVLGRCCSGALLFWALLFWGVAVLGVAVLGRGARVRRRNG